jgi:N-acetylmuramoyl-L-alanine amidase
MKRNQPKKVVLHCAATPDYPSKHPLYDHFTLKDVEAWHVQRGFSMVGYHYLVRRSGLIEIGRDELHPGAHVIGHNFNSLGICYFGTFLPTEAQQVALFTLYDAIKTRWGISHTSWLGHNELDKNKLCPGFHMELFRKILEAHEKGALA